MHAAHPITLPVVVAAALPIGCGEDRSSTEGGAQNRSTEPAERLTGDGSLVLRAARTGATAVALISRSRSRRFR